MTASTISKLALLICIVAACRPTDIGNISSIRSNELASGLESCITFDFELYRPQESCPIHYQAPYIYPDNIVRDAERTSCSHPTVSIRDIDAFSLEKIKAVLAEVSRMSKTFAQSTNFCDRNSAAIEGQKEAAVLSQINTIIEAATAGKPPDQRLVYINITIPDLMEKATRQCVGPDGWLGDGQRNLNPNWSDHNTIITACEKSIKSYEEAIERLKRDWPQPNGGVAYRIRGLQGNIDATNKFLQTVKTMKAEEDKTKRQQEARESWAKAHPREVCIDECERRGSYCMGVLNHGFAGSFGYRTGAEPQSAEQCAAIRDNCISQCPR